MPINTEDAFERVEFKYVNERDAGFVLDCEFHQTVEYGPSITIHNLGGGPLTLPASLYGDAVDYLRGRGSMKGGASTAKPTPSSARTAGTRLVPTKTANVPMVRPPVHAPPASRQVYSPPLPTGYEEPPVYAPQVMIMASEGAVESFSAPPAPKPRKQAPPPQEEEANEVQEGDEDGLAPEFSLAEAKRLKAEGKHKSTGRFRPVTRTIEPGEPGYEEQQAAIAALEAPE